jgi:hypothetical protein
MAHYGVLRSGGNPTVFTGRMASSKRTMGRILYSEAPELLPIGHISDRILQLQHQELSSDWQKRFPTPDEGSQGDVPESAS